MHVFYFVQQNSFNLAPDNPAFLTIWNLRTEVPRLQVPLSITSGDCGRTNSVNVSWVIWTLSSPLSYYNSSKDPKISKHDTAGTRKHTTLRLALFWDITQHCVVIFYTRCCVISQKSADLINIAAAA
jgi:hypothetical protein